MPITFLELSEELASSRDSVEKAEITEKLADFLGEEKDFSETVLRPLLLTELSRVTSLTSIMEGEYFSLRQRVYTDVTSRPRVALGVAFLQDHEDYDPDLDLRVATEILSVLTRENLDLLVNDITVNSVQVRDGALGSLL